MTFKINVYMYEHIMVQYLENIIFRYLCEDISEDIYIYRGYIMGGFVYDFYP